MHIPENLELPETREDFDLQIVAGTFKSTEFEPGVVAKHRFWLPRRMATGENWEVEGIRFNGIAMLDDSHLALDFMPLSQPGYDAVPDISLNLDHVLWPILGNDLIVTYKTPVECLIGNFESGQPVIAILNAKPLEQNVKRVWDNRSHIIKALQNCRGFSHTAPQLS